MQAKKWIELSVMVGAAVLEVGGDALIRRGLRGGGSLLVAAGFCVIGAYGVSVNLLDLDFSRLLGAYVGVFAVVSVLVAAWIFNETIAPATWVGLFVIVLGALIIHFFGTGPDGAPGK